MSLEPGRGQGCDSPLASWALVGPAPFSHGIPSPAMLASMVPTGDSRRVMLQDIKTQGGKTQTWQGLRTVTFS